jgi:hypothetical protein
LSRRKKKKKPAYDTGAQVRRLARALLGTAPGERVIPSKKKNKAKHKKREQEREAED